MYNESYEEYIRSILGYPNYNSMDYSDFNLESCYPEIYKVVYPMVNKACSNNTKPITPELVEDLTNEIYSAIEIDNEINLNINLTNKVQNNNRNQKISSNSIKAETEMTEENRGEDRQIRNKGLQDLIRILLIRELLKGRDGFPRYRPPIRPHNFNVYPDIYEI